MTERGCGETIKVVWMGNYEELNGMRVLID